jgi:superfamily II DNA/RNA helicase
LLFSATMPAPIKKLSDKFLTNPKQITVSRPASSNLLIEQKIVRTTGAKKRDTLAAMLRGDEVTSAIVFCNRKTTVRELSTSLKRGGLKAGQIHGDMEQAERIKELDRFKAEEINILVASDVAARGLDIKGVSHVFNFDVPWQPDDYVHRIGRTGRAGATGIAVTLVTREDAEAIDKIEKLSGMKIAESGGAPEPADGLADAPADEKPARRGRRAKPERDEAPPKTAKHRSKADDPAEQAAVLEDRPRRETKSERPRPEERPDERPRHEAHSDRADQDDGWNGPVPSFLSQGFGA